MGTVCPSEGEVMDGVGKKKELLSDAITFMAPLIVLF